MSNNVFLSSGGDENLIDGSVNFNGASLAAQNLIRNTSLRVDNNKTIVSSKLSISDTNGLQEALDATIQNPLGNDIDANGYEITGAGDICSTRVIMEQFWRIVTQLILKFQKLEI